MPTLIKVSFELMDTYRACIDANGVLGATVFKIDNAPSTKQLLKGKTPAAHAAPLQNKRIKQDLLRAKKLEQYPNGLGVDAILAIYKEEMITKPLPERYIHGYVRTAKGEVIIVTFVVALLKLLDDPGVTSFAGDTTFKGIDGDLNEWELTIFASVVQRAASILRAYINGASADFFEALFDELQRVKLMVTEKPIPFKIFVRGGNILVTNVDMDTAQVQGLCRSALKYSDPDYSGIPKDTPPEQVAPMFIKVCWRHAKEPVHDFKSLVSPEQFKRLMDFVYIDSKESLDAFSGFVYSLNIDKITYWWQHKGMHYWIIPCLVKSQSLIPPEIWDSTPRRKVDENVADEIQLSLESGILTNANNDLSHRMARNSQRQTATTRKSRESRAAADHSRDIQLQIDAEAEKRRTSTALTKDLKAQLKAAKGTSGKRGKTKAKAVMLSASSSGRVKMTQSRIVGIEFDRANGMET
ncbi:hypothetical protein C8R45DRAFT_1165738 [Mycena sanguinolenta]|nr:hypothetical protein C8R45DRAFT_1165738 [Mycena sanguinolenta]